MSVTARSTASGSVYSHTSTLTVFARSDDPKESLVEEAMVMTRSILIKRSPVVGCLLVLLAAPYVTAAEQAATDRPVKIYLLVGQSNMQCKGAVEGEKSNSLRYAVKNDPKREFQFVVNEDGTWRERSDVWIHYDLAPFRELRHGLLKPGYGGSTGQIGPELGFGHKIGDEYEGQTLLIKAAWGGKSLGHNFLPPSVGKYSLPVKPDHPGYFYHRILLLVDEVTENIRTFFPDYRGQGVEVAGLCWHQGWNDQYGGLDAHYESNMAAFIRDIRSEEHGLGVPGLPVVIATSGNIGKESPIKAGQRAMGDTAKYPEFAGNVAVVDTDKPYGPDGMKFIFAEKVGYHWNSNARSYTNMGRAMAREMKKLLKPKRPSRLAAYGTTEGVRLYWQFGTERPKSVRLLRNGREFGARLSPSQVTFTDATALPGKNSYELICDMPDASTQKLTATSRTYVYGVDAIRSAGGVTLTWKNKGKFANYKISRNGRTIEANLAGDSSSYEDRSAPKEGLVTYSVEPATGNSRPFTKTIDLGPIDPGDALVYEPFHYYPADFKSPVSLLGMKGAPGTVGAYFSLAERPKNPPTVVTGGSEYGDLPVMGNRIRNNFGKGCAIKLDGSLNNAGLLKDGATMWMSYVYHLPRGERHHGTITLQSDDHQHGIGFRHGSRQTETVIIIDGEMKRRRIGPPAKNTDMLLVAKFVWGRDGENDHFYPMVPDENLKKPVENTRGKYRYLREPGPFNVDQTKLSRLVLQDGRECSIDEIRVGPTYESVVGGGTKGMAKGR
jgi:alpha-galactosidase